MRLALWSPRIAGNVGAIGRLCAAMRVPLDVIRPIPFRMDDASMRRAGMDYLEYLDLTVHDGWDAFRESIAGRRLWLFTTSGGVDHVAARFSPEDVLLFGNEPHGVSDEVLADVSLEQRLRIAMSEPRARSLNVAMAAAIGLSEALRQTRTPHPA